MALLAGALTALFILMVAALVDLVQGAAMEDDTARLILAIAIIVIPPLGLLVYALTRPQVGRAVGTVTLAGSGVFIAWMVISGWH